MRESQLQNLADQLTEELTQLQKIRTLTAKAQTRFETSEPDELELSIPSTILQNFYNGAESILQRIARQIDSNEPEGEQWHRDLLEQMSNPYPNAIPPRLQPVIQPETVKILDEYRKMRHVVLKNYVFNLDWSRMKPLFDNVVDALDIFTIDIEQFINFLRMRASSPGPED